MKVYLESQFGKRKGFETGFSFYNLFLGSWYPLFKGDYKGFFIQTLLSIFTFGLSWFVVPFTYNKAHIKRKAGEGWIPSNDNSRQYLIQNEIFFYES